MSAPLEGADFAQVLVGWQKRAGRQHLPWQHTGDAYKVWLSEVMLQQTQVVTVLAYYARFLEAFPSVRDLAAAPEAEVMRLWAGLGYYSRARNLHACAKQVVARFGGEFPRSVDDLESLPGIGLSTAGAIASLAYGVQAPILDGNVKRVFCRYYGVEGYSEQSAVKKALWMIAENNVPATEAGVYNQALMDLGATCCTPKNPKCDVCPVMSSCVALRKGMVAQLPTPKPKNPRPSLYFLALVVRDAGGRVALKHQQEKGVWRDLWVPPLVAIGPDEAFDSKVAFAAALSDLAAGVNGLDDLDQTGLWQQYAALSLQPWLIHELTHRKMHFKVMCVQLDGHDERLHDLREVAVPRVVNKLIEHAESGLTQASVAHQDTLDF